MIKEPYTNNFAEFDMRNFYWSMFNRDRLNKYVNNTGANSQIGGKGNPGLINLSNPFYVFQYPNEMPNSLYNYDKKE